MSTQPSSARAEIIWPSVITVISAAILIGAEVFGAAFAGGWALAILLGLDDTGAHILQAVLFAIGVSSWWRSSARPSASSRSRGALRRASKKALRAQAPNAHASLRKLNVRSVSAPLACSESHIASSR